ncbi:MAG: D-aminoacyl-tRNA deacylase [Thermoplasmata archaeon]
MPLIIASDKDEASMAMFSYMLENYGFTEKEDRFYYRNFELRKIDENHIDYNSNFDESYGYVIFLSKHSSAAGIKSLTAHPTGNFGDARLGGMPKTLNISDPYHMSGSLRKMAETYTDHEFEVTFEATHHGPLINLPNFFVEIGTTKDEWTNQDALHTVTDAVINPDEREYPAFLAIGGGHYAPKITEYFKENDVNIGHIISKHDHDGLEKSQIIDAMKKTPGLKGILMDRKGTRGNVRSMAKEIADEESIELLVI